MSSAQFKHGKHYERVKTIMIAATMMFKAVDPQNCLYLALAAYRQTTVRVCLFQLTLHRQKGTCSKSQVNTTVTEATHRMAS